MWGIWVSRKGDEGGWLLDCYIRKSPVEWEPVPSTYKTKKEAEQECAWLNTKWNEWTYEPKRRDSNG